MNIYFLLEKRCKIHSTYSFTFYQIEGVKNTKKLSLLEAVIRGVTLIPSFVLMIFG